MNKLPQNLIVELNASTTMEMVLVEPGSFTMGNNVGEHIEWESPAHIVEITKAFYIGKHAVTRGQWHALNENERKIDPRTSNLPQTNISYKTIKRFINSSRLLHGLVEDTVFSFRMPTEAEWEYAAKGGHLADEISTRKEPDGSKYPLYAGSDDFMSATWNNENTSSSPSPVGRKQSNRLGLYDMNGNVSEWCFDRFRPDTYEEGQNGRIDPVGPSFGDRRVIRGGSYRHNAYWCRTTHRYLDDVTEQEDSNGFRFVLGESYFGSSLSRAHLF
jgi:formylglycine-generating enzyme required for sulfatase activity